MVDETLKAISTVGFPIVVAMYLMIRLENTFRDTTERQNETIKENTIVMTRLVERLERGFPNNGN